MKMNATVLCSTNISLNAKVHVFISTGQIDFSLQFLSVVNSL